MKTLSVRCLALLLLFLSATPSVAAPVRSWVGLNVGLLSGDVELPCAVPNRDCSEVGLFSSFGVNLTLAGNAAFRLRGVVAFERARERPYETAALIGAKLSRSWYGLIGAGRIHNADDDFEGNADGLAWELLYAPPTKRGAGFEFSLLGNAGPDVDYLGFSLGLRFGKLR